MCAFGTVADEQQRRAVEPGERVDCLVERVELAEAADPARRRTALRDRGAAASRCRRRGSRRGRGSTPVGVITIRRSSMPSRRTSRRDRLRPARDDVGGAQRRLLTGQLDPPAPTRPLHAPLLCLPDQRRGHEHHRRHAERARQARTGRVEQLVPLPHAGDVVSRSTVRTDRPGTHGRAASSRASLSAVLSTTGIRWCHAAVAARRELRVGRSAAQVVGRHHAVGRDDPDLTEEPAQPARPARAC